MPKFILLLCTILMLPSFARAETITIAADPWCPYTCETGAAHPGFMIEIAQRALKKHGVDVKYVIMPWARAINEARQGKIEAIVGASKNDAQDFIFPVLTQGQMRNAFYVKKDSNWQYQGVESLGRASVGVIADYSYSDEFDQYLKQYKNNQSRIQIVAGEDGLGINLKKLLAGRVDAVIEAESVMSYYLAKHNLAGKVKEAGKVAPSSQDNLYIAFSPKKADSKKYALILEKETAAMRANGELQAILDSYGLKDWDIKKK